MLQNRFGALLKKEEYYLDPEAVLINHGSYGAVPRRILNKQRELQELIERQPDSWYRRLNPQHHKNSLIDLCHFIGAEPSNTVFVENATMGMNSVLRSLRWKADDAILITNLSYHSVHIMAKEFAEVVKIEITFPLMSKEQLLDLYKDALESHPNIKLAIIDHITSPSSVLMPVKELTSLCHHYDVITLIDGAHAPGHIQLNLEQLDVDFYAGNLHKWLFTPRGCGFLWTSPEYHDVIRPAVISHFHGNSLHRDFCVRGTRDDTPYHTVNEAIHFFQDLGGWEAVHKYNTSLLEDALSMLETAWGTTRLELAPELQAPFMKLIRVPDMYNYDKTATGGGDLESSLYQHYNIHVLCMLVQGELYFRLSAQVYNSNQDYTCLRDAVLQLKAEPQQPRSAPGYQLPIMHWDLSPLEELSLSRG